MPWRRAWLATQLEGQWKATADRFRDKLIELYGPDRGAKVQYAEAFEISEYGSVPSREELKQLFPFF